MKNFVRSSLSVLLVLAMLLAIPAFAVGMNDTDNINKETISSANTLAEELYTEEIEFTPSDTSALTDDVYEITSLRERNVKHIYTGDGKYTAIVYGNDVHRINEKGELVDIDNRLTLKGDTYKTSDGRLSFDKSIASFNISENGYSIKMSLISAIGAQRRAPAIANHAERLSPSKNLSRDEKINTLKSVDNKTEIVYNDVMSGTDIEYILNSNDIKENIIIKGEQDSYSYRFTLELDGLTPTLNADGSISIYDSDIDVLVYTIPAPYMYDANGVYSYDAHYTLLGGTNGRYTLTVTADEDFVNAPDRAFPVILDPTIVAEKTNYISADTYVDEAHPYVNYEGALQLYAGNLLDDNDETIQKIAFIKTPLPTLPGGVSVTSAELNVPYHFNGISEGYLEIGAFMMDTQWTPNEIVWDSDYSYTNINSYCVMTSSQSVTNSNPSWAEFNILTAVQAWYSGTKTNNGIALWGDNGTLAPVVIKSQDAHDGLYSYLTVQYEFSFVDGVYSIKNIGNQNSYMTVTDSSTKADVDMMVEEKVADPAVDFQTILSARDAVFKISRVSSISESKPRYVIRLMTNNNLTIAFSETDVVTKMIPTNDALVPASDTFYIEEVGNAFYIIPYSSPSYVIGAGNIDFSSYVSTSLMKVSKSSAADTSRWTFTPYMGDHVREIRVVSSTDSIFLMGTYEYNACVSSTVINENGPIVYSVSITDIDNPGGATINSSTGLFTPTADGKVKVRFSCTGLATVERSVNIYTDDGIIHTFKSVNNNTMMLPVNSTNSSYIAASAYSDNSTSSMWKLEYVEEGYFKIKNDVTGYYLIAPSNNTNNAKITQGPYNPVYGLWKFHITDDNYCIIQNKTQNETTTGQPLYLSVANGYVVQKTTFTANKWDVKALHLNVAAHYDFQVIAEYRPYFSNLTSNTIAKNVMKNIIENNVTGDGNHKNISEFFKEHFGIKLNIIYDDVDYETITYSSDCLYQNDSNALCINCKEESVNPQTELNECQSGLHHKSANKINESLPSRSNSFDIIFSGHKATCHYYNGEHKSAHNVLGIAEDIGQGSRCAVFIGRFDDITEYDKIKSTLVHEMLHLLGVEHHPEGEEMTCVHGERSLEQSNYISIIICDECVSTANAHKLRVLYPHNP